MVNSSGKKGSTKDRAEITYFAKPADRKRTVLETPAVTGYDTPRERRRRDTPQERGRARDTLRELPVPAVTSAPPARKERRRTTELELEVPAHARPGPDGIVRHGAKTLGKKQIAELAQFGHHLFESGRASEAKAVFEGLVEVGVQDAFPHTMLGILFLSEGAPDRALALFEAALALDPADLAARVYRAEVQLGQGKVRAAHAALEAVLEEAPVQSPFAERARKLLSEGKSGAPVRRKRR